MSKTNCRIGKRYGSIEDIIALRELEKEVICKDKTLIEKNPNLKDYFGCKECSGYETKRECYNGR